MIVYTYAEFGRNCLKNKYKYYTLFRVLRWEFASVYKRTYMFSRICLGIIVGECV